MFVSGQNMTIKDLIFLKLKKCLPQWFCSMTVLLNLLLASSMSLSLTYWICFQQDRGCFFLSPFVFLMELGIQMHVFFSPSLYFFISIFILYYWDLSLLSFFFFSPHFSTLLKVLYIFILAGDGKICFFRGWFYSPQGSPVRIPIFTSSSRAACRMGIFVYSSLSAPHSQISFFVH